MNFLTKIKKSGNQTGDLFNQNVSTYDEIIKTEANSFLLQNGNKLIKQELEIKTANSQVKMSGKFAKAPSREQALDEAPELIFASVDGLINHQRTVYLKLPSEIFLLAYFEQKDFKTLIGLMLREEVHQFSVQKKIDAGGKKNLYLISI